MKIKDFFKSFIARGAIIYTVISMLFILINAMISDNAQETVVLVKLLLYIALYSYILSLGSTLFASGYFSAPIAHLIHAICFNVGLFASLMLAGMEFTAAIICTLVFAVLYALVTVITALLRKKTTKKQPSNNKSSNVKTNAKTNEKTKAAPKVEDGTYKNRFS